MRTLLKALAILVALWLYAVVRANSATLEDQVQTTAVHIITGDSECSGTMIESDLILTARHCIRRRMDYVEIGGPERVCKHFGTITKSKDYDLATIRIIGCGPLAIAYLAATPIGR